MFGCCKHFTGDPIVDQLFTMIESEARVSFADIRQECSEANQRAERYPNSLRKKLASVRQVLYGLDGYEQITQGRPTAFGYEIDRSQGLDISWEAKSALNKLLKEYLQINSEKDKDSIGKSIWKAFYEGAFWTAHKKRW